MWTRRKPPHSPGAKQHTTTYLDRPLQLLGSAGQQLGAIAVGGHPPALLRSLHRTPAVEQMRDALPVAAPATR